MVRTRSWLPAYGRFLRPARTRWLRFQRVHEQQSGLVPVASHGALGHSQDLGNLEFRVAAEVTHPDHLRQARLGLLECEQGFVDMQDLGATARQLGRNLGDLRTRPPLIGRGIAARPDITGSKGGGMRPLSGPRSSELRPPDFV